MGEFKTAKQNFTERAKSDWAIIYFAFPSILDFTYHCLEQRMICHLYYLNKMEWRWQKNCPTFVHPTY